MYLYVCTYLLPSDQTGSNGIRVSHLRKLSRKLCREDKCPNT